MKRSHHFTQEMARCNHKSYKFFFSCTSHLWNTLLASCFQVKFDLQKFKSMSIIIPCHLPLMPPSLILRNPLAWGEMIYLQSNYQVFGFSQTFLHHCIMSSLYLSDMRKGHQSLIEVKMIERIST